MGIKTGIISRGRNGARKIKKVSTMLLLRFYERAAHTNYVLIVRFYDFQFSYKQDSLLFHHVAASVMLQ